MNFSIQALPIVALMEPFPTDIPRAIHVNNCISGVPSPGERVGLDKDRMINLTMGLASTTIGRQVLLYAALRQTLNASVSSVLARTTLTLLQNPAGRELLTAQLHKMELVAGAGLCFGLLISNPFGWALGGILIFQAT